MFICSNCQKEFLKWQGQCDSCKLWNTLIENTNAKSVKSLNLKQSKKGSFNTDSIKPIN